MKGLIFTFLIMAAPITQAGAYRWVDENGQTHFGDRPPVNAVSDEVHLDIAPSSIDSVASERKQRVNEFLQQAEKERNAREQAQASQATKAAKHRVHCESLEARLKYLKSVSGIYRLNKDGERVFVNDDENERIRNEFRSRVQNECKN
ncbi:DUF4124 domain-containing protein [Marinobacter sp. 1_MG-2023]|uniref:DUF4124 domain-containing protein n=1 Tax=Marinobacter sp. 1_MG-2023 TaxID=3062627 RepID=UPI0026E43133|nr:DUF4124 domain-containing protein [Marinobacter sp. 1_MG-2023]MDO6823839.1 DUF4124 domain-containing protein [Marinobacter sp. 1_MG-2023]